MISGGQIAIVSPILRTISPSSSAARRNAVPTTPAAATAAVGALLAGGTEVAELVDLLESEDAADDDVREHAHRLRDTLQRYV